MTPHIPTGPRDYVMSASREELNTRTISDLLRTSLDTDRLLLIRGHEGSIHFLAAAVASRDPRLIEAWTEIIARVNQGTCVLVPARVAERYIPRELYDPEEAP